MLQTPSPNSLLAKQIALKLAESGLIPKEKQMELAEKLETGTVKESDWRIYVELALPRTNYGGRG